MKGKHAGYGFMKCGICGKFMAINTEEIYPYIEERSPYYLGEPRDPPEIIPVHQGCYDAQARP